MNTEGKKPTPRWRVQLWAFTVDAATGGMLVMGAVFVLALAYIWLWGVVAAPTPLQWALRGLLLLAALVWLGRRFDRWTETRRAPATRATYIPQTAWEPDMRSNQCSSERMIHGHLNRCELNLHRVAEYDHQVSRPNGRWIWGIGEASGPVWYHDAHWSGHQSEPPPEPFSWTEHNKRRYPHPPRRTDEARP